MLPQTAWLVFVSAAPVAPGPVAVELMVVDMDIPLHLKCRLGGESLLGLGCRVILWRVFHDSGSAAGPAVSGHTTVRSQLR